MTSFRPQIFFELVVEGESVPDGDLSRQVTPAEHRQQVAQQQTND